MKKKFYGKRAEHLKVTSGSPTSYYCSLRVEKESTKGNSTSESHLTHGPLKKIGTQLFHQDLPELGAGSYLQLRQDGRDNNTIDIEIVRPKEDSYEIKKEDCWHHHPQNHEDFYYKEFIVENHKVTLAIGSGYTERTHFEEVLKRET